MVVPDCTIYSLHRHTKPSQKIANAEGVLIVPCEWVCISDIFEHEHHLFLVEV